jgi:hypothetical protein
VSTSLLLNAEEGPKDLSLEVVPSLHDKIADANRRLLHL